MNLKDHPHQKRYQRPVIALSGVTSALPITLSFTVLAILIERAGGSAFEVGMVVAIHFLGLLLFAPIWGTLADITHRRRAILVVTTAFATGNLVLLSIADSVWGLISLRGLFAVFVAAYTAIMFTIVSERGGETGRGRHLGEFNSARSVGFAIGQLFAGIFLSILTAHEIFLVLSGISLVVLVTTALITDPTPTPPVKISLSQLAREVKSRLVPTSGGQQYSRSKGLHFLYAANVLHSTMFFGILSLLPVFLTAKVGVTEVLMGVFLAMNPGGRSVFMYLFGRVSDGHGRKSLITWGLVGSGLFALIIAGSTAPEGLFHRKIVVGTGFLVMAIALSAFTIGTLTFIGDVSSINRESELMGLRDTAQGIGGVIGPALLGTVVTLFDYEAAFILWSVFPFLGAGLVVLGVRETNIPGEKPLSPT